MDDPMAAVTTTADPAQLQRPDKELYFLLIAMAARTRADCIGRHVGAVITREARVLSTGYNGTPFGVPNCSEGGCHRCTQRREHPELRSGAYDVCICVHAEQNAILTAARFGQQTFGAGMTTTVQPCFGCLKEMLQAGITEVRYLHPWDPEEAYGDPALTAQYAQLKARFDVFTQVGDPGADTPELFAGMLKAR